MSQKQTLKEIIVVSDKLKAMAEKLLAGVGDAEKFDGRGTDAAGRRLRKLCLDIARDAKETRSKIQDIRNNRKA